MSKKKYVTLVILPSIIITVLFFIKYVLKIDFIYSLRLANMISKISAFQILLILVSAVYIIALTHKYISSNAITIARIVLIHFFAIILVFINPIIYCVLDRFIYTIDIEGKLIIKTLFLLVFLITIIAHVICFIIGYVKKL